MDGHWPQRLSRQHPAHLMLTTHWQSDHNRYSATTTCIFTGSPNEIDGQQQSILNEWLHIIQFSDPKVKGVIFDPRCRVKAIWSHAESRKRSFTQPLLELITGESIITSSPFIFNFAWWPKAQQHLTTAQEKNPNKNQLLNLGVVIPNSIEC